MLSCTSQTCTGAEQRKRAKPGHNKNAPYFCKAFGAENETRTISYNVLIISDFPCQCGGVGALLAGCCRNRRQRAPRFPEIQGFRQSRIVHTARRRRSGASTFRKQLTATQSPYIAPLPSRHDTQQIPVDRSLG